MADDRVGRDAGRFGEPVVTDVGRDHFQLVDNVGVANVIQRFGAYAWLDVLCDHRQYICGQTPCHTQADQVGFSLDSNAHWDTALAGARSGTRSQA